MLIVYSIVTMDADTLEREWEIITDLLPPDWEELAWETGALKRARKVRDPDTLLLLIMLHAAAGLSLRQAVARAERMEIASLSDVALMKRMRNAEPWLHELAVRMFATSSFDHEAGRKVSDRRVRVVDATTISEPGNTGTDWRLHYVLRLPSLECDFFELTDQFGGETYKRFPVDPGDVLLGDRGYCHREGVAHVVDQEGDVVVRLNGTNFPLQDEEANAVDFLERFRTLDGHIPGEWSLYFEAFNNTYDARLCAVRKSTEAARKTKQRLRKNARKSGRTLGDDTLEFAEYVFVLTTLPKEQIATEEVLELYRARWQVEVAFKRIKSLFGVGHVPKYDDESSRAWLYAKLVAVLLIERLIEAADFFSPWGFDHRQSESMA